MHERAMNISPGTAKCMRIRCSAVLMGPDSRQSVDRLPLVTVAKTKEAAENIQCTDLGEGMLMPPNRVVYCSHKFSALISWEVRCESSCPAAASSFSTRVTWMVKLSQASTISALAT